MKSLFYLLLFSLPSSDHIFHNRIPTYLATIAQAPVQETTQSGNLPSSFGRKEQIIYQDDDVIIRADTGERKFPRTENSSMSWKQYQEQKSVELSLAQNEVEGFHLTVTPKTEGITIQNPRVSDFTAVESNATLSSRHIDAHKIDYVWESKNNSLQSDAYADVLSPIKDSTSLKGFHNYNLYFKVETPKNQDAGDYSGDITLNISNKEINIPVDLRVWNFQIPETKSVNTQLFNIDKDNIYYAYNIEPWGRKAQGLISDLFDQLAKNRISPGRILAEDTLKWENFPIQTSGLNGNGLDFQEDKKIRLAGPKFSALGDSFSVGFYIKPTASDYHFNLSHFWSFSGYDITLSPEKIISRIGAGRANSQNRDVTTRSQDSLKSEWNYVVLTYDKDSVKTYLNGALTASEVITDEMHPSMRILDVKGRNVILDQLTWTRSAISPSEVQAAYQEKTGKIPGKRTIKSYSFDSQTYRFQDRRGKVERSPQDWANWLESNGLWFNDVKAFVSPEGSQITTIPLSTERKKKANVLLPHDEKFDGPKSERNQDYAKSIRKSHPKLTIAHTFGAMMGRKRTAQQKIAALRSYVGSVDIWSTRPFIYERFPQFFQARQEQGDTISPYIHRTDKVEKPLGLINGRLFFWKLYSSNLHSCTYWTMNLWNFPLTRNGLRKRKKTVPVADGFATTQRNPDSIVSGQVLWPGEKSILFSLRTEAWRDGMEDYERFKILENLIQTHRRNPRYKFLVERGTQLLNTIDALSTESTRRWEFESPFSHYQYHLLRESVGETIDEFSQI